jgi:glycosyltransferase involved in cell wall biosynthesis
MTDDQRAATPSGINTAGSLATAVGARAITTAGDGSAAGGSVRTASRAASRAPLGVSNGPLIVLDVSRLLSRAGREAPTGIDRVELAYAQHLIGEDALLSFAATDAVGKLALLPQESAKSYIAALASAWHGDTASPGHFWRLKRLAAQLRLGPLLRGGSALRARLRTDSGPSIYLLVSHYGLEADRTIKRLKRCRGTRFVCLIHDLIPIEFPEYAKPGQDRRHRRRIETAVTLGDAIIVGSTATRDALQPYLDRAGRTLPVLVAPFGWHLPAAAPVARPEPGEAPYFVCVGTIEARKNHLLLLNLWRGLAAEFGTAAPRLLLVGQRGWLTQNVIDMLERCPALRGLVIEHNSLPDAEMAKLVRGARALLLPSFAEGFGFPVVEALALGVPVLCSGLRALRETGGQVPEYLHPLDGCGWRAAILDYAAPQSSRREMQLRRLAAWQPARWEDHFAAVRRLVAQIAASPSEAPPP